MTMVRSSALEVPRWLGVATTGSHAIYGAPRPDVIAIAEMFQEAARHVCDAVFRKQALLAQVTSTTISSELLTAIQTEVAAGAIT